ncbi:MAG: serine hydrolase [Bacteroidota bacterium]
MNYPKISLFGLLLLLCYSVEAQQHPLQTILKENPNLFEVVISQPERYETQIIYTQINRDAQNRPHFTSYTYGVDSSRYFYPASTIKMPVAFAALEKLRLLQIEGLDRNSPMHTGVGRPPQTAAQIDSTAPTGSPSLGHYIRKIFAVSDNDASNRLYEFLGQEYLNRSLRAKGFDQLRIVHRLGPSGAAFGPEDNQYTNPISFYNDQQLLYHQGPVHSKIPFQLQLQGTQKGQAYYAQGEKVNQPFDFSPKNFISLQNLHDLLKTVLFPESVPEQQRFAFTKEDYQFLYHCLSIRPRECKAPVYDKPDGYVKFFLYGGATDSIPDHIRIYNKVGWAYGYLTDVAYIVDFKQQTEFLLAATIHVNANQTYNDNTYEYETIGLPFLQNLGQVIYDYEVRRKKGYLPDLSYLKK